MVDKPEVITNEDFEYIVQAEREFGPSLSVVEDTFDDVTAIILLSVLKRSANRSKSEQEFNI